MELLSCETAASQIALSEKQKDISKLENVQLAADRAYRAAGIGAEDVDVAEVHDCFTIAEAQHIESFGFYGRGEGIKAATMGETYCDGKKPANTDGGLKAKGHPVGTTGVAMAVEVVKQLRGEECNQVKGAKG